MMQTQLNSIRMMKTKAKVRNNMENKNSYVEVNLCDLVYAEVVYHSQLS